MRAFLFVGLGGAVGAMARYGTGLLGVRVFGAGFPFGTLAVNLIGGFAMGILFATAGDKRETMALLGAGVLGGFTTFSAFSLETVRMFERGAAAMALAYAAMSVIGACGACWAGMTLVRSLA